MAERCSEDGHGEERRSEERHSEDGYGVDGHGEERHSEDGHSEERHSEDGHGEERRSEERRSEERRSVDGRSEERRSEERRSVDGRSEERRSEERRSEDGRGAHLLEVRQVDDHGRRADGLQRGVISLGPAQLDDGVVPRARVHVAERVRGRLGPRRKVGQLSKGEAHTCEWQDCVWGLLSRGEARRRRVSSRPDLDLPGTLPASLGLKP